MGFSRVLVIASLAGLAAPALAACYTVYDRTNRILYQSDKPPVDMSLPLHETVPERFPGGQLVFDVDSACPVVSSVAQGDGGPITRTSSPLLTDKHTANRLRGPHSLLDGVAVIPSATAALGGPPASPTPAR